MELITDFNALNGLWVFEVSDADTSTVLYYGCEHIRTIPTLRELRRHSPTVQTQRLKLELITPVASAEEGEALLATLKALNPPRYGSLSRKQPRTASHQVQCIDTGRVYDSLGEAARDNGITVSYLYMHLKGAPQATKCRGLRFKRV